MAELTLLIGLSPQYRFLLDKASAFADKSGGFLQRLRKSAL